MVSREMGVILALCFEVIRSRQDRRTLVLGQRQSLIQPQLERDTLRGRAERYS